MKNHECDRVMKIYNSTARQERETRKINEGKGRSEFGTYEGLRELGDLQVDNHVCFGSVSIDDLSDSEFVGEESRLDENQIKGDRADGLVDSVRKGVSEDLSEIPRVGSVGGKDSICRRFASGDGIHEERSDAPTERVMIVPSLRRAIMRTMNGGKSNLKAKAMMAKPKTIRIVTVRH